MLSSNAKTKKIVKCITGSPLKVYHRLWWLIHHSDLHESDLCISQKANHGERAWYGGYNWQGTSPISLRSIHTVDPICSSICSCYLHIHTLLAPISPLFFFFSHSPSSFLFYSHIFFLSNSFSLSHHFSLSCFFL